MKKILIYISVVLIMVCGGCSSKKRSDSFIFRANDKEIALDYDDMTFINADGYGLDLSGTIQPKTSVSETLMLDGRIFAEIGMTNLSKKEISKKDATVTMLEYYLDDYSDEVYFNEEKLSLSVKENCDTYKGNYEYNNGYYCVLTYKNKTVELYGNIFNIDQDWLERIIIK